MEYFSTIRNPGVVFRVPATKPCHPKVFFISAARLAAVATPLARLNVFNAVLSAKRIFLHLPARIVARVKKNKLSVQ